MLFFGFVFDFFNYISESETGTYWLCEQHKSL